MGIQGARPAWGPAAAVPARAACTSPEARMRPAQPPSDGHRLRFGNRKLRCAAAGHRGRGGILQRGRLGQVGGKGNLWRHVTWGRAEHRPARGPEVADLRGGALPALNRRRRPARVGLTLRGAAFSLQRGEDSRNPPKRIVSGCVGRDVFFGFALFAAAAAGAAFASPFSLTRLRCSWCVTRRGSDCEAAQRRASNAGSSWVSCCFFFFLAQTKMSWRSLLTSQYSR